MHDEMHCFLLHLQAGKHSDFNPSSCPLLMFFGNTQGAHFFLSVANVLKGLAEVAVVYLILSLILVLI